MSKLKLTKPLVSNLPDFLVFYLPYFETNPYGVSPAYFWTCATLTSPARVCQALASNLRLIL